MLLSVIIPVYHGAVTIQKLVDVAQEQLKVYSFEIVLINDGSKDDSEKVCLELSAKFKNISFLSLRKNFGEFQAVMCGLNHAKGDYSVIIDDDFQNPPSEIIKLLETAQKEDFDVVIDLQNNKTSHLLAFLCGARLRAGHQNRKWSFLLNRAHRGSETAMPPLEHQFKVLKMIDIEAFDRKLQLWSGPAEERAVDVLFASQWVSRSQTLVGINPGSSLRWPTKQWPVENFAKLCDELAKRNIRVVVTGAPEDVPLADELFKITRNKPINAVGKTSITELVSLVKRCQVFISSDSAPMHIASSVNIPLIAIFGPTDPKRHLVAPANYQVFWKEVQCSPCYLRSCPMGLICMKRITVQEVLDSVLHFLKERRPASVGGEHLLATP